MIWYLLYCIHIMIDFFIISWAHFCKMDMHEILLIYQASFMQSCVCLINICLFSFEMNNVYRLLRLYSGYIVSLPWPKHMDQKHRLWWHDQEKESNNQVFSCDSCGSYSCELPKYFLRLTPCHRGCKEW